MREIVEAIDEAGSADSVPASLLPKLRGRLLFARSLAFGRFGGDSLRSLGAAIQHGGSTVVVRGQLARALFNLRQYLLQSRPREIRVAHPAAPLIFVDGAFEPRSSGGHRGGIGGILLDPATRIFEFFPADAFR